MSNKQIYEYYNSTNEAINFKSSIKNFLLRVYPQAVVPEIKYLRDLPKTAEVLELGCGDGHVLEVLGKMGYERILGVELANNYKRRHPNIVHGDLVSHRRECLMRQWTLF